MRFPRALLTVATATLLATPAIANQNTEAAAPSAATSTVATAAVPAFSEVEANASTEAVAQVGKALFSADGRRLGSIYKVTADGSAQLLLDSRMYVVPASSLSLDDRKIVTSLSKKDIIDLRR